MLHGYRDTAETMLPLAQNFAEKGYEVVIFDLPLHGTSTWHKPLYAAADVAATILLILKKSNKPFSLLGYSLGGRLALVSLPLLAQAQKTPENVWLLAPAGCPQNALHYYIEMPLFLKKAIQYIADSSRILVHCARFLYNIKLLGKFELAFAERQLGSPDERKLVFMWWQSLSYLLLDFGRINKIIKANKIQILMFFGNNDVVLPQKSAAFFQKNLLYSSVEIHDATHRSILKSTIF